MIYLKKFNEGNEESERARKNISDWSGKVNINGDYKNPVTIIPPGVYDILDGDMEGRYFTTKLTIEVTEPIDAKELVIQMAQEEGYVSPWSRIDSIRKSKNPESFTSTYPVPTKKKDENEDLKIKSHIDIILNEVENLIPLTSGRSKSNLYKRQLTDILKTISKLKKSL